MKQTFKTLIRKTGGKYLRIVLPRPLFFKILKLKIKLVGRAYIPAETSKAYKRRLEEGFFKRYIKGQGLDIGYGGDPLTPNVKGYDFEHGNALYLDGLKPYERFDYVYSSHCLEHMNDPRLALKIWWHRVKEGGYLIFTVPHRDLFEKQKTLPSSWNQDHKFLYMPEKHDPPYTLGVRQLIKESLDNYKIIYVKVCDKGYEYVGLHEHSKGEYSIEAVIKKNESLENENKRTSLNEKAKKAVEALEEIRKDPEAMKQVERLL